MIWTSKEKASLRRLLLSWYNKQKRDMPWRKTSDPYRIVLSEFMLQQTRVDTVIPYYERFISAFPTVHTLADADLDEVLKLWEGLGYYSRARNLHKAAMAISREHNGSVPEEYDSLFALPGFGPYTTAAVLSIAYAKQHAVLDGNVIRVLARLQANEKETDRPAVKRALQHTADELLNDKRPGDHNQAMMELGATVCKPRNPVCPTCPIQKHCRASARGVVDRIPRKSSAKPRPERTYVAAILRQHDRYLVGRRKEQGLLGGLWEFPSREVDTAPRPDQICDTVAAAAGVNSVAHRPFRTVKHAYTHFTAVVHAYQCDWVAGEPASDEHDRFEWADEQELQDYACSRITRKLVVALFDDRSQTILDLDRHKERMA